jgi:hypothetical protein
VTSALHSSALISGGPRHMANGGDQALSMKFASSTYMNAIFKCQVTQRHESIILQCRPSPVGLDIDSYLQIGCRLTSNVQPCTSEFTTALWTLPKFMAGVGHHLHNALQYVLDLTWLPRSHVTFPTHYINNYDLALFQGLYLSNLA